MNPKIKIGIDLGDLWSLHDGFGEFSTQYCRRLSRFIDEERLANVEIHLRVRNALHRTFGSNFQYLPQESDGEGFDLWHSVNQNNQPCSVSQARERMVTIHDLNFLYEKKNFFWKWRRLRALKKVVKPTNHIATISNYVKNDIQQVLQYQQDIAVVYNGSSNFIDYPKDPMPDWDGRPYLFHLSRMAPSKNIAAMLALAQHWPGMNFIFSGPECHDTRAVRSAARAMPNVRVLLDISNARKSWLFDNCAGFIFPSLTEGFGLPPIEAMHFGKPVFLSRKTCLPEIGQEFAAYFDDFSSSAMRSVIETMTPILSSQSESIKKHAASFNWDRCAADYIALYSRILGIPLLK